TLGRTHDVHFRIRKVVRADKPIRSNLLLDAEVPLMDEWRLDPLGQLKHLLGIGERQIRIHHEWEWTTSRKTSPRFLEAAGRAGDDDVPCPGRSLLDRV